MTIENYTIDPDGNSIHIYVKGVTLGISSVVEKLVDCGVEPEEAHKIAMEIEDVPLTVHAPLFPDETEELIENLNESLEEFENSSRCYYPQ